MWSTKFIFGLNRLSKILSDLIFSYTHRSSQLALQYRFRAKILLVFFNVHYEEYVSIPGRMRRFSLFQNCPTSLAMDVDKEDLSRGQNVGFMTLATHCYLGPILLMNGSRLVFFYMPF
jgi:hypothetical protein